MDFREKLKTKTFRNVMFRTPENQTALKICEKKSCTGVFFYFKNKVDFPYKLRIKGSLFYFFLSY